MNERIGAESERGSRVGQFLSNGMLEDNYPRNMWWVRAHRPTSTRRSHIASTSSRGKVTGSA